MKISLILLGIFSTALAAPQEAFRFNGKQRFDNDKLVRFCSTEATSMSFLWNKLTEKDLDVWGADGNGCYLTHVPNSRYSEIVLEYSKIEGVSVTLANDNIQRDLDEEERRLSKSLFSGQSMDDLKANWFKEYHTYDQIKQWYSDMCKTHSDLTKFVPSIGKTHEGRDLFAIHLTGSKSSLFAGKPKRKIWFESQIHAREWLSGTTLQYIFHELVSNYGKNNTVTDILDSVEIVIVPIVNPDGYDFTWTNSRLWRKNRRENGPLSHGVDLNRNFNVHWDLPGGSSRSPWSETYRGPAVASEPETQAVTQYFLQFPEIVAGIDFHTFSQLVLRPYGHTSDPSPHEEQLKRVADGISSAIYSVHGKTYTSIPASGLYPTTGAASDWFYSDEVFEAFGHRVYGYTIELRPKSMLEGGFVMDPKYIIPTGEELFEAILYFIPATLNDPLK